MTITLTKYQEVSLRAIMDTFIALLDDDESLNLLQDSHHNSYTHTSSDLSFNDSEERTNIELSALAAISASDTQDAIQEALIMLERATPPNVHSQVLTALSLLSFSWSAVLMTGHRRAFAQLTRHQREQVLFKWRASTSTPQRRFLYKTFSIITLASSYSRSDILLASVGYPHNRYLSQSSRTSTRKSEATWSSGHHLLTLKEAKMLQYKKFDVIVVGGGTGGGVMAAQIASVGYSVLVIEKGIYYRNKKKNDFDKDKYFAKVDEGNNIQLSKEGLMAIVPGNAFGEDTVTSSTIPFKPYTSMLDSWSQVTDDLFNVTAFLKDLETVSKHNGVLPEGVTQSKGDKLLKYGCMQLGVNSHDYLKETHSTHSQSKEMNFIGGGHGGHNKKQTKYDPTTYWLLDAEHHGARFLDQTRVTRILTRDGAAVGIDCMVNESTKFTFMSTIVVVAAGSLDTPNLLRQSGLKNRHIGRHLFLHPTTNVLGFYRDHDNDSREQVGNGSFSGVISHVPRKDGYQHEGSRIFMCSLQPEMASISYSWRGALDHKRMMAKYRRAVTLGISVSDIDSENTVNEAKHRPIVNAKISRADEQNLADGIVRAFRILAVTGARELYHPEHAIEPFYFDDNVTGANAVKDARFHSWLERVRQHGISDGAFTTCQLGSWMGKDAQTSVTKVNGETWDVRNLFISDGSLFITPSGVNPRLTIETLAYGVSRHVITRLRQQ